MNNPDFHYERKISVILGFSWLTSKSAVLAQHMQTLISFCFKELKTTFMRSNYRSIKISFYIMTNKGITVISDCFP